MPGKLDHFVRLAAFYFAICLVAGVHLPFWPVWLVGRGLSASDIGLLTMIALLLRVVTGPLIALAVDRIGQRRTPIIALSIAMLLSFALFGLTHSFMAILFVTLLSSMTFPAIMPLIDTMTLNQYTERKIDYGQVRLWGSISFIAATTFGGWLFSRGGYDMILLMVLIGCGFTVATSLILPRETAHSVSARGRPDWRQALELCRDRRFLFFVAAGSLIQAGHAVYYTFGTLNWLRLGIGDTTIGMLWALGVISEIILFAFSPKVSARCGPVTLLALGGAAGIVRWTLTAFNPSLPLLIVLQCLHAFTFGAVHLGAMHFINQAVPKHLAVTAQGVYGAVSIGVVMGAVTYGAGLAYTAFDSRAYLGMALLCGIGCLCALQLRRVWAGEVLAQA